MSSTRIQEMLKEQAEDDALQFIPETISEAYALQEYWRLHEVVADCFGLDTSLARTMLEAVRQGRRAIQ